MGLFASFFIVCWQPSEESEPEQPLRVVFIEPGTNVVIGEEVVLEAEVTTGELSRMMSEVAWSSSLQGPLNGETTQAGGRLELHPGDLEEGTHEIRVAVVDELGRRAQDLGAVAVLENSSPTITTFRPTDGSTYDRGSRVGVSAWISDATHQDPTVLQLSWRLDGEGPGGPAHPSATGKTTFGLTDLEDGEHTLSLTVEDPLGATAWIEVSFALADPDTGVGLDSGG